MYRKASSGDKNRGHSSTSSLQTDKSTLNAQLYEEILKDPRKRAMVLQLLSQEKDLINDYLQKGGKPPIKTVKKKVYCESPTAQFRRKVLKKKQGEQDSDSSNMSEGKSLVPSPVPFENLLEGVIAYVEVKTKSGDRSSATKAVVASMGATVREQFTRDVTHVIFKDGSFSTYQKAKLMKVHLVSLLWIEAVRRNHVRVPEKDYPALGTEAFNANLSVLCQQMQDEYEEALQDEVQKTFNTSQISPEKILLNRRATALPSELFSALNQTSARKVTKTLNQSSRRFTMHNTKDDRSFTSSDSASDCGMIDGEITKKIISKLDMIPIDFNPNENSIMKAIENIEDSKRTSETSKNSTADTSNGSVSLLNVKKMRSLSEKKSRQGIESENVDMDLTGNVGRILNGASESKVLPRQKSQKKTISKKRLFTGVMEIPSSSDLSKSDNNQSSARNHSSEEMPDLRVSVSLDTNDELNSKKSDESPKRSVRLTTRQKLFSPPKITNDSGSTMSSLRLSVSSSNTADENVKANNDEFVSVRKRKIDGAPSKTTKQQNSDDGKGDKKTSTRRKLYDPNEELDGANIRERESYVRDKNHTAISTTFKMPTISLTPLLLTVKAKRFLEEKKDGVEDKVDSKPATQTTAPVKSTQTKSQPVRNVKSTGKKEARKRSSSFYFDTTPIKTTPKKTKKISSIVCTRLHKPEVEVFQQIVKKLGGFFVEDEVSNSTTHLVAGEPKRTVNLLRALARGCWILKHEWLLKSLEAGKWLPEEEYELIEFSRTVQRCRIERQAFGSSYSMDLFQNCGYIYVARSTIPRCSDLQELVRLCKGRVTTCRSRAKIVVGEPVEEGDVTCVKETWILDSIAEKKIKPLKKYLIEGRL